MPRNFVTTFVTPTALARRLAAAALFAAVVMAAPAPAGAQVVVVANGSPITNYDIDQRSKLIVTSSRRKPTREEVIQELIDDRLKLSKARFYGFAISDEDVERAFASMASRQHITVEQFRGFLQRAGISPDTIKAKLRADLTWNQLVRGKFSSSLQVGEAEVATALRERNEGTTIGFIYTLYPVMVVIPAGSSNAVIAAKQRTAENLRSRFANCKQGLDFARAIRDVAVREPVTRSSGDLPEKLRELLGSMPLGTLTPPEQTAQGIQMFALCEKKESRMDSPLQHQLREQIFAKRFERESKKYLEDLRKSAMIEYK